MDNFCVQQFNNIFIRIFAVRMSRQSEQIVSIAKTLGSQSGTDNTKQMSKSSISSKSQAGEITLQSQIVQLKQKAHQSFMQVIQMQQLHEQELQVLRSQFIEKQAEYQHQIAQLQLNNKSIEELELRVKQLEYENLTLEKNYKHHHICDFQQDDLSIDNIELITYQDQSRLDQSSILNFEEIVNIHKHDEKISYLHEEIQKELKLLALQNNLGKLVEQLFECIQIIKKEFIRLQDKNNEKEREKQNNQSTQNNKFYENLQKESKFMAEHIKRLSGQKMKVQKKLVQSERQHKVLQQKIKQIEANLSKKGVKLDQIVPRHKSPREHVQHQKSLELNEFIVENFNKKASSSNPISKTRYGLTLKNKI